MTANGTKKQTDVHHELLQRVKKLYNLKHLGNHRSVLIEGAIKEIMEYVKGNYALNAISHKNMLVFKDAVAELSYQLCEDMVRHHKFTNVKQAAQDMVSRLEQSNGIHFPPHPEANENKISALTNATTIATPDASPAQMKASRQR